MTKGEGLRTTRDQEYAEVNSGMAIIIPAQKIVETLAQPVLRDRRNAIADAFRRGQPVPEPAY